MKIAQQKINIIWITGIIISTIAYACSPKPTQLEPFRWQKAGGEFDSVTLKIDRLIFKHGSCDSVAMLAERLENIVKATPSDKLKESRTRFFRGCAERMTGNHEQAEVHLRAAREMIDPAAHPYDIHRIDFWLVNASAPKRGIEAYNRITSEIDFYESMDDPFMTATQYGDLGLLLKDCGDYEGALKALEKANILFRKAGFPEYARNNMLNIATCRYKSGQQDYAVSTLRTLIADSAFSHSPGPCDIALTNLYLWSGDTAVLHEAWNRIRQRTDRNAMSLKCQLATFLADEAMKRGEPDSALLYSRIAIDHTPFAKLPDYRALAMKTHSDALAQSGMTDSAYLYLRQSADLGIEIEKDRQAEELILTTTTRDIASKRLAAELDRRHHTIVVACVVFTIFVALLLILGIIYRRMQRQRLQRIRSELEMEKMQRRILAMQIAMQEKDTILDSVGNEVASLTANDEISRAAGNRIESSLKANAVASHERASFIETFSSINPSFSKRLKEHYPSFTDSDIKLASFIAVGLDSKHIARILAIRPESVKQGRWRLRSKMGLTTGQSLEQAIAAFMEIPV